MRAVAAVHPWAAVLDRAEDACDEAASVANADAERWAGRGREGTYAADRDAYRECAVHLRALRDALADVPEWLIADAATEFEASGPESPNVGKLGALFRLLAAGPTPAAPDEGAP